MNPYAKTTKAYKQAAVNTDDQGTLILMLYDGAIRFCKTAQHRMTLNDLEGVHNNLVRSKDIVAELLASLNVEAAGELGKNLKELYTFVFNKLIDANVKKDMKVAQEALLILEEMREGWRHVVNQHKKQPPAAHLDPRAAVKTVNLKG